MERYKQYKQTNNLLHVFSLTLFIFASLFSVTGIVYSLVTVGIGSPLFLLCSIGFATCTMLSAYNAYAIHNNITHRRSAPKKETACSTNKKLIILKDNLKNLNPIDFNNQSIPNKKYDTQQYISCVPKTSEEALIPRVVENVKQNNKPDLTLNDKKLLTSQNLKSPSIPQTQGSNFTGPTRGILTQPPNNTSTSYQPQMTHKADKSKTLPQLQNISNPNKSTAPIPPPMPTVVKDKPKILSQPQNTINQSISITSPVSVAASEVSFDDKPLPPPPPPMPEVNTVNESRISPQSQLQDTDDLTIPTTHPPENNLSATQSDRSTFLGQIREIGQKNLRKTNLARSTDTVKTPLQLALEKRAEAFATSWSKSDSSSPTPDSDWEEEVKVPFEIQEQSSNKPTEDYVEGSNHHIDSGISDGESSPEKINNHIDKGRRSSSNSYTEGSVEQPKNFLSHSSSCPSFIDINMSTL